MLYSVSLRTTRLKLAGRTCIAPLPLRVPLSRYHSTQPAIKPKPKRQSSHDDAQSEVLALNPSTEKTTRTAAIELVDGRARHLSWTSDGGVTKQWREISAPQTNSDGTLQVPQKAGSSGRVTAWLRQMFLPTNYPQSVHPSYMPYHLLQFAETIIGTLVSVLCNQALLVSVGVSAEASIFGAVAVQWIIKDGAGEVAKLFFIRRFSPFFDSHPKTFNLIGAGGVLLGSGLQIASLLGPATTGHFLLCAAGGNIFKLIGNAIWFTTHIKFVRCFARTGNTGDVAAKSESQASVGQLLGYAAGIGLLTVSHSAAYLYSIFAVAVPAHMAVTGWMLRVATFEMLTLPRVSWLAGKYVEASSTVRTGSGGVGVGVEDMDADADDVLPSLQALEKSGDTGFFGEFYKAKRDKYLRLAPKAEELLVAATPADRERWEACVNAFDTDRYLLYPSQSRRRRHSISILYNPHATSDDILRSILHATALRRMLINQEFFEQRYISGLASASRRDGEDSESELAERHDRRKLEILVKSLHRSRLWTASNYEGFKARLVERGWMVDEVAFADHGRRVLWGSAAY